jgi:hypothetical protein
MEEIKASIKELMTPDEREELESLRQRSRECIVHVDEYPDPRFEEDGRKIWMKGSVRNCINLSDEQVDCIMNWRDID